MELTPHFWLLVGFMVPILLLLYVVAMIFSIHANALISKARVGEVIERLIEVQKQIADLKEFIKNRP